MFYIIWEILLPHIYVISLFRLRLRRLRRTAERQRSVVTWWLSHRFATYLHTKTTNRMYLKLFITLHHHRLLLLFVFRKYTRKETIRSGNNRYDLALLASSFPCKIWCNKGALPKTMIPQLIGSNKEYDHSNCCENVTKSNPWINMLFRIK